MSNVSNNIIYSEPMNIFSNYGYCDGGGIRLINQALDELYEMYGSLLEGTILYDFTDVNL